MNIQRKITGNRMTSKGQVLIPKAIREAAGLVPGGPVKVAMNDRGEAVVSPDEERAEAERYAEIMADFEKAAEIFRRGDRFPNMSTDEYMAMIREPLQPFEIEPDV